MVNTPAEDNLLGAFADLVERGGGLPKIVPEIQRVKFAKNLWNVTFSSVATLVRYPLPSIYRAPPNAEEGQEYEVYASNRTGDKIHEYTIANIRAVMEEVVAVGNSDFPHRGIAGCLTHSRVLSSARHGHPRLRSWHPIVINRIHNAGHIGDARESYQHPSAQHAFGRRERASD